MRLPCKGGASKNVPTPTLGLENWCGPDLVEACQTPSSLFFTAARAFDLSGRALPNSGRNTSDTNLQ